jgi:hypothetical protein
LEIKSKELKQVEEEMNEYERMIEEAGGFRVKDYSMTIDVKDLDYINVVYDQWKLK